jgi:hypothetical protein
VIPAAISKAESLARHVDYLGCGKGEFVVALTKAEAEEFLDYLASGAMGQCQNAEVFEADVAEARAKGDPFLVLERWSVLGFPIVRVVDLN